MYVSILLITGLATAALACDAKQPKLPVERRSVVQVDSRSSTVGDSRFPEVLIINDDSIPLASGVGLGDIPARLGSVSRVVSRDHGNERICYVGQFRASVVYISFESNEMGGPERELLRFTIGGRGRAGFPLGKCHDIGALRVLKTNNGMEIGMGRRSVEQLLQTEAKLHNARYHLESDLPFRDKRTGSTFFISQEITVLIDPSERVSEISAFRLISN